MDALLEGKNISVWRGDALVIDELSLCVLEGTALQLRGSNGSGKTTLLRILLGLLPPDEGEVLFRGQPLDRVKDAFGEQVLYLGHRAGVSDSLTASENLKLWVSLCGATEQNIEAALAELTLSEAQMRLPCRALSAGQKRRVALARLILQPAQLWVLDEPLSALDADGQRWVTQKVSEHLGTGGSVLLTTHQPLPLPENVSSDLWLDAPEEC